MTDVEYVDSYKNCYDPERDTVILDKKLKEPGNEMLHEFILHHELTHALHRTQYSRKKAMLKDLKFEFIHDFKQFTSLDERYIQLRKYHRSNSSDDDDLLLHLVGYRLPRMTWNLILAPLDVMREVVENART